jgi:hypothetical protein
MNTKKGPKTGIFQVVFFSVFFLATLIINQSAVAAPQADSPFSKVPSFFTRSLAQTYGEVKTSGGIKASGRAKILRIDLTVTFGQNFVVCWIGSRSDQLVLGDIYVLSPLSFFFEDGKMCAYFTLLSIDGVAVPPGTYKATMVTSSGYAAPGGFIVVN